MKTLRITLVIFAFLIAITGVYATMFAQTGYYNTGPQQAANGTITTPFSDTPPCLIQSGFMCTVKVGFIDKPAYATYNGAAVQNSNFLLRYQ